MQLTKKKVLIGLVGLSLICFSILSIATGAQPQNSENAFIAQNDAAMNKMMKNMAVPPSGDVDKDFVALMVPHHQGAIEMAQAVLRYGHNEQLRRIAQEIIVDQQQEIAAMHLALGQPLPPSYAAPTEPSPPASSGVTTPVERPSLNHNMKM